MEFESLAKRIDSLPLILCGPIVRQSHDKGITVWLALKKPVESIMLSIFEDNEGRPELLVAVGISESMRFGEHLHIAVVTATPLEEDKPLKWGNSFLYDISFDRNKPGGFESLKDTGVVKSINEITYHEHNYQLPAVVLPPEKVDKLHFIQCSCRDTKGVGLDAMLAADDILTTNWSAGKRPQQLLLTGDQIYADEVDAGFLHLIIDAAKVLLSGSEDGWEEALPVASGPQEEENATETINASEFGPFARRELVQESAMFTTKSGESHLLSLGEFFAMYLLIWSETLWPQLPEDDPETVPPNAEEVFADWMGRISEATTEQKSKITTELEKAKQKAEGQAEKQQLQKEADLRIASLEEAQQKLVEKVKTQYSEKKRQLLYFRFGIRKVRRVLANISTYMVFDDHEVTDDWHLNREWADEVYQTALGRRIMQNALAAFGVFQAWGNTPDQFRATEADLEPAGKKLLDALVQWISAECANENSALEPIANAVNIPHNKESLDNFRKKIKEGKIPQSEQAVKWYFSFIHPKYHIVFTDARSQRSLPGKRFQASEHLSEEAIVEQIPLTKVAPEFTLLVSPCNLLTINYFRNWVGNYVLPAKAGVERAISAFKGTFFDDITRQNVLANDPDLADSWVQQSKAYENLMSRLASRIPIKDGNRQSRFVVISGDVHFSATMRMHYRAKKPFRIYLDEPTKDTKANIPKDSPAEMVMAHLVCSAAKNEAGIFHYMHYLGYEVDDTLSTSENLPFPEVFLGYHKKEAISEQKRQEILLNTRWFSHYRPSLLRREPVLIPFHRRNKNINYAEPDWVYRIDALRGESLAQPEQDPQDIAGVFKNILPHIYYSKNKVAGLEIMSVNNIAEISFSWSGEGKLTHPMSLAASECELEFVKKFPKPPFQVIIDEEIIEIQEVEIDLQIIKFLKIRRKIDKTKAVDHSVGTTVKIRKTVNQNHWIVERDPQPAQNGDSLTAKFSQSGKKTLKMVVPMGYKDPFYQPPEVPLLETDAETDTQTGTT